MRRGRWSLFVPGGRRPGGRWGGLIEHSRLGGSSWSSREGIAPLVFLFDLGGVLLRWRNNGPIYNYIGELYGIQPDEVSRESALRLAGLESGKVSIEEFMEDLLNGLGRRLGASESAEQLWVLPFERDARLRLGMVRIILYTPGRGRLPRLRPDEHLPAPSDCHEEEGVARPFRWCPRLLRARMCEAG